MIHRICGGRSRQRNNPARSLLRSALAWALITPLAVAPHKPKEDGPAAQLNKAPHAAQSWQNPFSGQAEASAAGRILFRAALCPMPRSGCPRLGARCGSSLSGYSGCASRSSILGVAKRQDSQGHALLVAVAGPPTLADRYVLEDAQMKCIPLRRGTPSAYARHGRKGGPGRVSKVQDRTLGSQNRT